MAPATQLNRPLRILIVEDSKVDVNLLLYVLRSAGYQVEYDLVQPAPAMRAALERQPWDLITSDHKMPQFSAPQAVELAKELRSDVPIFIVSGEADPDLAMSLKSAGAQDYVLKMEMFDKLVSVIELVLQDKGLGDGRQSA